MTVVNQYISSHRSWYQPCNPLFRTLRNVRSIPIFKKTLKCTRIFKYNRRLWLTPSDPFFRCWRNMWEDSEAWCSQLLKDNSYLITLRIRLLTPVVRWGRVYNGEGGAMRELENVNLKLTLTISPQKIYVSSTDRGANIRGGWRGYPLTIRNLLLFCSPTVEKRLFCSKIFIYPPKTKKWLIDTKKSLPQSTTFLPPTRPLDPIFAPVYRM
jgi:hypothetical protein